MRGRDKQIEGRAFELKQKKIPIVLGKVIGVLRLGNHVGKILVVVDEDIEARDPDSVNWALTFRIQPRGDVRILDRGMMDLDPSIISPEMVYHRPILGRKARP